MKSLCLIFIFLSTAALAECDLSPLRKQIVREYSAVLPVTNEKGEVGSGMGREFVISDHLMRVKNETFLIANFDMDIKWQTGEEQSVKTLLVASVDPATCLIEMYETGDTLGTSMTRE